MAITLDGTSGITTPALIANTGMTLPVGTTAQRPASPSDGSMRINTTTNYIEVYYGGIWSNVSAVGYILEIFVWGAGGGSGGQGGSGTGGGGGAAYGVYAPTVGTNYPVVVGGGGGSRTAEAGPGTAPAGGGGLPGLLGYGGQGGGYSGVFLGTTSQGTALLIAGGGGGGAYEGAAGGAGGGTDGVQGGAGANTGGGGGTQTAGGTTTGQPGSSGSGLQGGQAVGDDTGGGGGGGGGYWGGAGGRNTNPGSGGGGGSGYANASVSSALLFAGSGATPGDNSNSLRGTAGVGGASGVNSGNPGIVVIRYLGTQRGAGGTVTSSGGYTIHTFTTAGTFIA